jgi:hypothetical protein
MSPFVYFLSYTQTQFDLALYILCYETSITDDTSEDFGHIELNYDKSSSPFMVHIWLKNIGSHVILAMLYFHLHLIQLIFFQQ